MDRPAECRDCSLCQDLCVAERSGLRSITSMICAKAGSAFNCAFCWQCVDECPASVDLYDLMTQERRLNAKPLSYLKMVENIRNTGYASPVTDRTQEARLKKGLDKIEEIPPRLLKILFVNRQK